jgi:hypothetical protein
MEMSGQLHASATLPPEERAPGTHWIGGWVGPRARLAAVEERKILRSKLKRDDVRRKRRRLKTNGRRKRLRREQEKGEKF